jgi:hypothetical protein
LFQLWVIGSGSLLSATVAEKSHRLEWAFSNYSWILIA